ncbi:MAG TPA: Dna2/Cas4 domain-containing protein [Methanothrix sp.]|nr:Dna2/Cas4 domain-containing protein [Methanothrix sp.]HRW82911.1 Dna2/Cas4 domain-containing protein [Methanothrix sp.]
MPPTVRISDISLYLRCPRLVYFQAMGRKVWPETESPTNLLMREVALSLSELDPAAEIDLEAWLLESLDRAESELPVIYGEDVNQHDLRAAAEEIREILPEIAPKLSTRLDLLTPSTVEVDLRSDRLGLSGRIDRIVSRGSGDGTIGEVSIPSIIRNDRPPETGVWKNDRLRLTGYAILLEDESKRRVDSGIVEYPRAGEVREVEIRSSDRRRVLRIRDRVRSINGGKLPDRPRDAPCDRCPVLDSCETRHTLASKFF